MNKRGISAVVATVFIILITVAGVTIIWGAIIPMIRDNLDFSALEGRVFVVTSGGYTFYDASTGLAKVQVKRDMDDGVMNRIKIDFSIGGNSVGSSVVAPDSGNTKVYIFDLSDYGEPESVSVAPIFAVGQKEKIGSVTSNVKVGTGNIGSYGFVYDAGKDYVFDIADGLVSWWRMNGDANDEVGDNDGMRYGDTDCSVGGRYGGGCSFDGSGDYVQTPHDDILDFGKDRDLSLAAWIKIPSTLSDDGMILIKSDSAPVYYRLTVDASGSVYIALRSWSDSESLYSSSLVNDDEWHHVLSVVDRDVGFKMYIDGVEDGSNSVVSNHIDVSRTTDLFFGTWHDGSSSPFDGLIDEVMIFDRVLSSDEAKALYELDLS